MYKKRRVDANQASIVKDLRKLGYSVAITSYVGNGFPDIVVGKSGMNYLFELKDGEKCASQQKLTEFEKKFSENWQGQFHVAKSIDDILYTLNSYIRNSI